MVVARRISFILALLALSLLPVRPAGAQCVSLTTLGSAVHPELRHALEHCRLHDEQPRRSPAGS